MGFRPRDVYEMSLWEFGAAWAGWKRANGAGEDAPKFPTAEEHHAAVARAMGH